MDELRELMEESKERILDKDLMYKLIKTLREINVILPKTKYTAIERYNARSRADTLDSIMSKGDVSLERWLKTAQQRLANLQLEEEINRELEEEEQ